MKNIILISVLLLAACRKDDPPQVIIPPPQNNMVLSIDIETSSSWPVKLYYSSDDTFYSVAGVDTQYTSSIDSSWYSGSCNFIESHNIGLDLSNSKWLVCQPYPSIKSLRMEYKRGVGDGVSYSSTNVKAFSMHKEGDSLVIYIYHDNYHDKEVF